MDWERLRLELAEVRHAAKKQVSDLAKATGLAKTTVYRLENTEEVLTQKPKIETIERWAGACGLTLSEFFARLDSERRTPADLRVSDTTVTVGSSSSPSPFPEAVSSHGPGGRLPISTPEQAALAELRAFIERLSVALLQAATGNIPHPEAPGADAEASNSR